MMQSHNTPIDPSVQAVISSLYRDAKGDKMRMVKSVAKATFKQITPTDMKSIYMPISQDQGEFIYHTILERDCKTIIEFGTSFGISTLFLGAAARKTNGRVITTEIVTSKADRARKNFEKAGLSDVIDLRVGDALETLKDNTEQIDFLLLDGWKDLYLPLFRQLEPFLQEGAIIYADNINMADAQPYVEYINDYSHKYISQTTHQGKAELTTRV